MPLASLFGLQWYGPAQMTMTATASAAVTAHGLSAYGRLGVTATATASATQLALTRLKNSPLLASSAASAVLGPMRGSGRMGLQVKVNELTQDDVAGAILDAPIDGVVTLRQMMRLIGAASAGKVSGAAGTTVTIRDLADTKNRIVATVDASGNRSAVTRDLT